ncbi:MAG: AEC family transporter [Anaerolineales bacterium]
MSDLFQVFTSNLLPIILISGIGFALQKCIGIDPKPISQIVFYAFSPALVFNLLTSTEISVDELMRMASLTVLNISIIAVLCYLIGRARKLEAPILSAFIISASFMNAGNYGLPLARFAFGESGLAWASNYFVASSMMVNSVGVYVISVGKQSPLKALLGLLKVPSVYAIPLALFVRANEIALPLSVTRPIELLGSASIPVMIVVLGIQIARLNSFNHKDVLSSAVILRLVASPLIAWLLVPFLHLDTIGQHAGIIQSAMPAAVFNMVIATKFDVEAEFVTGVVAATTILSPLTVTALLVALGV